MYVCVKHDVGDTPTTSSRAVIASLVPSMFRKPVLIPGTLILSGLAGGTLFLLHGFIAEIASDDVGRSFPILLVGVVLHASYIAYDTLKEHFAIEEWGDALRRRVSSSLAGSPGVFAREMPSMLREKHDRLMQIMAGLSFILFFVLVVAGRSMSM